MTGEAWLVIIGSVVLFAWLKSKSSTSAASAGYESLAMEFACRVNAGANLGIDESGNICDASVDATNSDGLPACLPPARTGTPLKFSDGSTCQISSADGKVVNVIPVPKGSCAAAASTPTQNPSINGSGNDDGGDDEGDDGDGGDESTVGDLGDGDGDGAYDPTSVDEGGGDGSDSGGGGAPGDGDAYSE